MVHSSTKMTPAEAMKPQNQLQVKINLELQRKKYSTLSRLENL